MLLVFAPARKREILDSCRPPDVVVTDGAVGAVSVGVCSPPSRLVTALRTRVAGLTALTAAPRTPVQTGSCPTAPHARPLHVVVDHLSRIHHFEANVDTGSRPAPRPSRHRLTDSPCPGGCAGPLKRLGIDRATTLHALCEEAFRLGGRLK